MILSVKDVTKRFGGLTAVKGVSVDVEQGKILGIIGPNGAGKTTFLNCISGYYTPEEGEIKFEGKNIIGLSEEKRCHLGIGRTYQIVRSFPKMTAIDNVRVSIVFGNDAKIDSYQRAAELLEFVEFPLSGDVIAEGLNNIQQKRLELARALGTGCKLLLLDEVASGLTPSELPDFIKIIKKIRDMGVTIICIEHVMKFIMELCDKIIVLNFGEKIADGTPEEIRNDKKVMDAYFGNEDVH